MIEKILERLERKKELAEDLWDGGSRAKGYAIAIKIVQEVAKEYGKDTNVRSNGWIPVETELPKEDGMYLCTVLHANKYNPWIMRFKNGEFLRPDDVEDLDYEVLAWQRIAPYQKGE